MSMSRRKPRRKLQHQLRNVDGVLFGTKGGSNVLSNSALNRRMNYGREIQQSKKQRELSFSSDYVTDTETQMKSLSKSDYEDTCWKKTWNVEDIDKYLNLKQISCRVGLLNFDMDEMGDWTAKGIDGDRGNQKETTHLAKQNEALLCENNMLKIKNELLAKMIAQKTVQKEIIDSELRRLRKLTSTSSSRFSANQTHK